MTANVSSYGIDCVSQILTPGDPTLQSIFSFIDEQDLTDSDNSWYYLYEDEVHKMFDDWQLALRTETHYQCYILYL